MKTVKKNKGPEKIEFKADSLTIFTNYSPIKLGNIHLVPAPPSPSAPQLPPSVSYHISRLSVSLIVQLPWKIILHLKIMLIIIQPPPTPCRFGAKAYFFFLFWNSGWKNWGVKNKNEKTLHCATEIETIQEIWWKRNSGETLPADMRGTVWNHENTLSVVQRFGGGVGGLSIS